MRVRRFTTTLSQWKGGVPVNTSDCKTDLLATLWLIPQKKQWQQAAEAMCTRAEPKSLPLENHSSVAQIQKRGEGEGGKRRGMYREKGGTGQEEERQHLQWVRGKQPYLSHSVNTCLYPNSNVATTHKSAMWHAKYSPCYILYTHTLIKTHSDTSDLLCSGQ